MSMDHTYKFFGFYISHTILNLPLSILYLPNMLPQLLPFPLPTDNPPYDLYFCESVPVLVVCLVFVFLGSVIDSCEFVDIGKLPFLFYHFKTSNSNIILLVAMKLNMYMKYTQVHETQYTA